jgi:hypothetical protein
MTFHESREKFQKGYAAGRDAYHEAQDDRRVHTATVVISAWCSVVCDTQALHDLGACPSDSCSRRGCGPSPVSCLPTFQTDYTRITGP